MPSERIVHCMMYLVCLHDFITPSISLAICGSQVLNLKSRDELSRGQLVPLVLGQKRMVRQRFFFLFDQV
jgi:hypothetical protein